jgi:hypothetical protein
VTDRSGPSACFPARRTLRGSPAALPSCRIALGRQSRRGGAAGAQREANRSVGAGQAQDPTIALLLEIAAAVISHRARHGRSTFLNTSDLTNQFIIYGTAVLFLVFGSIATYGLAGRSRELLEPTAGPAHSAIVRYAILLVGAFTTLLITPCCSASTSASSCWAGRSPHRTW